MRHFIFRPLRVVTWVPDLENFAKKWKIELLAIVLSLVRSVGLIIHIVIADNDMQLVMMVKVLTKAFQCPDSGRFGPILAQKCQKSRFLTILSSLIDSIGLILHIVIASNDMQLVMMAKRLTKAFQGPDLGRLGPILAQK